MNFLHRFSNYGLSYQDWQLFSWFPALPAQTWRLNIKLIAAFDQSMYNMSMLYPAEEKLSGSNQK